MSDYLTDEEQAQRLENWWGRYGLLVIGAVILAVAAVVGYRWWIDQQAQTVATGAKIYEEFRSATGEDSRALVGRLDAEAGATGYPVLARFRLAALAAEEANYAQAIADYQDIIRSAREPAIQDLARIRLARFQQQLGKTDEAMAALQSARSEGFRSLVAELKGDILLASGDAAAAHEAYEAAVAAMTDGQSNPLLELKASSTAQGNDTQLPEQDIDG
ncbi:MAG: tetratricopeptide repeat protein [Pseudomonadota bacterium]